MLFTLALPSSAISQTDTIKIRNGSFESNPQQGRTDLRTRLDGWEDCGRILFPYDSPPDIHPNNYWDNNVPPSDGDTYLGLVVRDVESWESMTQILDIPLEKGQCYKFSVNLASSDNYKSASQLTKKMANYTEPAVLRVWAGSSWCQNGHLIAESERIGHKRWKRYDFEFETAQNYKYITIEAYYKTPVAIPYNGNLLVDKLTNFVLIPCEEEALLANVDVKKNVPPHKRKPKPKKEEPKTSLKVDDPVKSTAPPKKKILAELDRKNLHTGQKIRIDELFFKADTSSISASSYPVLDEVYEFMIDSDDVIIEIGGHTNSTPKHAYCDKLSTDRAREVALYLIERGLPKERVKFKGYGKRKPVASNFSKEGRKKNQRVEIKILSLNG